MPKRGPMTGRQIPEMSERDIARFFAKVNKTDTHWLWTAGVNNWGYPVFGMNGTMCFLAHRISLHLAGIAMPPGMVVDHICRKPLCVNPEHLRVVTPSINSTENSNSPSAINARKTHCKYGHPLSGDNMQTILIIDQHAKKRGEFARRPTRRCLTCYRTRYERLRAA